MSPGPRRPASPPRLRWVATVLVVGLVLFDACFDSDEKPLPAAGSTSTGPAATTVVDLSTTSTGAASTSTGDPEVTCRDAIDCVFGCAAELQTQMLPEPDLTCFLDCEQGLTVGEALDLFYLTECVTQRCIGMDKCDRYLPTGTGSSTGDDSTSSTGGSGSGSGSSTGDPTTGGPPQGDECLECILAGVQDKQVPDCEELAMMCT